MNREWVGRTVARAYPAEVRAERGAELVGTLLDAGGDSWAAFIRQLGSLIGAGLAARTRAALLQPPAQIATCALAWAAVMTAVLGPVAILGSEVRFGGHLHFPEGTLLTLVLLLRVVLPILAVVLFTLNRIRTSGLLGLAWAVCRWLEYPPRFEHTAIAEFLLPLVGFGVMVLAPQRMPVRGRWFWLVPAAVFAYFEATGIGAQSGIGYIAPLIAALCLLPFNPSFAIGTTLAWSVLGVVYLTSSGGAGKSTELSIVLVSCVPLALIAVGIGRLRVHRA
jgi:hypothetical protein